MQNITAIAPAITAFFFTATIVGFTGAISPFAYFLGFLVVLALGMCLVQLAKLFPSAGGYFTYVSRTLGPAMLITPSAVLPRMTGAAMAVIPGVKTSSIMLNPRERAA